MRREILMRFIIVAILGICRTSSAESKDPRVEVSCDAHNIEIFVYNLTTRSLLSFASPALSHRINMCPMTPLMQISNCRGHGESCVRYRIARPFNQCGFRFGKKDSNIASVATKMWVEKTNQTSNQMVFEFHAMITCDLPEPYSMLASAKKMRTSISPKGFLGAEICQQSMMCPSKCENKQSGIVSYLYDESIWVSMVKRAKGIYVKPDAEYDYDTRQVAGLDEMFITCKSSKGIDYKFTYFKKGCSWKGSSSEMLDAAISYNAQHFTVCFSIDPLVWRHNNTCNEIYIHSIIRNCSSEETEDCSEFGKHCPETVVGNSTVRAIVGPLYMMPTFSTKKGRVVYAQKQLAKYSKEITTTLINVANAVEDVIFDMPTEETDIPDNSGHGFNLAEKNIGSGEEIDLIVKVRNFGGKGSDGSDSKVERNESRTNFYENFNEKESSDYAYEEPSPGTIVTFTEEDDYMLDEYHDFNVEFETEEEHKLHEEELRKKNENKMNEKQVANCNETANSFLYTSEMTNNEKYFSIVLLLTMSFFILCSIVAGIVLYRCKTRRKL